MGEQLNEIAIEAVISAWKIGPVDFVDAWEDLGDHDKAAARLLLKYVDSDDIKPRAKRSDAGVKRPAKAKES